MRTGLVQLTWRELAIATGASRVIGVRAALTKRERERERVQSGHFSFSVCSSVCRRTLEGVKREGGRRRREGKSRQSTRRRRRRGRKHEGCRWMLSMHQSSSTKQTAYFVLWFKLNLRFAFVFSLSHMREREREFVFASINVWSIYLALIANVSMRCVECIHTLNWEHFVRSRVSHLICTWINAIGLTH